jgi:hypothetical protein
MPQAGLSMPWILVVESFHAELDFFLDQVFSEMRDQRAPKEPHPSPQFSG